MQLVTCIITELYSKSGALKHLHRIQTGTNSRTPEVLSWQMYENPPKNRDKFIFCDKVVKQLANDEILNSKATRQNS